MSIIIKAYVEDMVIDLLNYHQSITQNTDYTGRPSAKPVVQTINFSYKTIKKDLLFEKLESGLMSNSLKFVTSAVALNAKSKKVEALDFYVTKFYEKYDSVNKSMVTYVSISFATLIINDVIIDVKYWRKNDPYVKNIAPTKIANATEKKLTSYYLTNTENKEIQDYKEEDIIVLNIETSNRIRDVITINLDDAAYDFEYNGSLLPNDTLNNIVIGSDLEQIELKVIKQKKTD